MWRTPVWWIELEWVYNPIYFNSLQPSQKVPLAPELEESELDFSLWSPSITSQKQGFPHHPETCKVISGPLITSFLCSRPSDESVVWHWSWIPGFHRSVPWNWVWRNVYQDEGRGRGQKSRRKKKVKNFQEIVFWTAPTRKLWGGPNQCAEWNGRNLDATNSANFLTS